MLSAECIVSSASTLPEACSLLSDNLSDYYSFRSHSSQIDFAPFMQSKVGAILRMRDVSGFIIDDATLSYIQQKNWTNSEQQLALMVQFKEEDLRLFQSSGI
jgi:hypothetical protein